METEDAWIGEPLARYEVVRDEAEGRRWERVEHWIGLAWRARAEGARARAERAWARAARALQHAGLRAQAQQWWLEWRLVEGRARDEDVGEWPPDDRLRARQLLACGNAGVTPAVEAWGWLVGRRVETNSVDSAAWRTVWGSFCAELRQGSQRWLDCVRHEQPICWLAGTPAATIRTGVFVEWGSESVRAYFRTAWERWRRTGREVVSRVEEEWWLRVRTAFPRLRVERHVPLPGTSMHLDIYWPRRGVALEIQGEPHWYAVEHFGGAAGLAQRQERDARKRAMCRALGITLIEVTPGTPWEVVQARLRNLLRVRGCARRPPR